MLLNEKIEIIIYGNQRKYYESIGYNVPTYIDKKGRIKVKNGTKMVVNVLDLPKGSSLKIKYIYVTNVVKYLKQVIVNIIIIYTTTNIIVGIVLL